MKRNKSGVSLIVLVITIIVMTIIAGAVIFSLADTDIFNKANDAVKEYDLKQVQSLASLVWAEAFLDETVTTDEQYDSYVETKLTENHPGILSRFDVVATAAGVTVTAK